MAQYVEVRREVLLQRLEAAGFSQFEEAVGGELVYERQHHKDPTMFVRVFTSLSKFSGDVRGCGEDAIRVVLIFRNQKTGASGCLFKAKRINRVGTEEAVIERTIERARDAYKAANDRCKNRS